MVSALWSGLMLQDMPATPDPPQHLECLLSCQCILTSILQALLQVPANERSLLQLAADRLVDSIGRNTWDKHEPPAAHAAAALLEDLTAALGEAGYHAPHDMAGAVLLAADDLRSLPCTCILCEAVAVMGAPCIAKCAPDPRCSPPLALQALPYSSCKTLSMLSQIPLASSEIAPSGTQRPCSAACGRCRQCARPPVQPRHSTCCMRASDGPCVVHSAGTRAHLTAIATGLRADWSCKVSMP